ncbi:MAG: enoyl-CoA hydratase/isomerase family protein [Deltaproteobacteria bacterium]|nr:enoyl-CoA hydratase/isomerase family protein [Deltaproteobacteria bacterium]
MATIFTEIQKDMAVLTLNNGTTNSISPDLVRDLSETLDEIRNEVKGIVLCGGAKFFSIGLDLPLLIKCDRAEMSDFWYKFNHLILVLYTVSLPTVCVLSGHAVAGGNILALTCDYRFAGTDTKKIGLNEIKLGVPIPYLADMLLRQIIGDRSANEVLYSGDLMSFSEAKEIRLIDEIYSTETVMQKATEKAAKLSEFQVHAFSAIKSYRTEEIRNRYEKNGKARNEAFLDCWFSEPTQRLLKEACQRF